MKLPPILLHYYITERCNCRCRFCSIWQNPAAQDARLSDVVTNLRAAARIGVRFVDFTGGEPLLHDELPTMLAEAKRLGLRTSVTTNGLRYPDLAKELRGRIDFLHFSLDALDESLHDELRGRRVFQQVMHNIDLARSLGETPDLLFTITPLNRTQLQPMIRFAQRIGLMLIVNPLFSAELPHQPNRTMFREVQAAAGQPFVYVNPAFHRLRRNGGNQRPAPRCRAVSSTLVISPDSYLLLPCYHFHREKIPLHSADTAKERSLSALEQACAGALRQFYAHRQGRFSFCQGCHLNCYADPSFVYRMDEYFWESLMAKMRYWYDKNIYRRLQAKRFDRRPALVIAKEIMNRQ
ncbi:MAG: radical SAM protein [candidate division KSB1 bacterium]|nr:radical SAM protein [candidate division KSB1 bacterium]